MRGRLFPSAVLSLTLIAAAAVVLLAAGLLAVTSSGGGGRADASTRPVAGVPGTAGTAGTGGIGAVDRNSLSGAIAVAQVRLRTFGKDDQTWAELGSAYVQQARITIDPSYYPKAEGALAKSLQLKPAANVAADVGEGSLANARHEFADALVWGRKAAAADPYNAGAYAVIDDAQTQLGDYRAADAAVQKMLDLQPGLSSFSRASYSFEERGDVAAARRAMQQALAQSSDPADIAFCRYYLGELAFNNGDPRAALEQYRLGLIAQPTSDTLLAGRAKSEAALGRSREAVRDYAAAVAQVPQPEYVLEYGQLLDSIGQHSQAQVQYQVLGSIEQLFAANGVVDDLTSAVFDADHGSAADAVRHARAEWQRRHSVLVADALAWALHRSGDDKHALVYARTANRLGWRNATFAYHLGMIELSLGKKAGARRDLTAALKINPYFSLAQAPKASAALTSLAGPR